MTPTTGYILSTEVKGLAYYAQKGKDGFFILNGLRDNAYVFKSEETARNAMKYPEFYKYTFLITEVQTTLEL